MSKALKTLSRTILPLAKPEFIHCQKTNDGSGTKTNQNSCRHIIEWSSYHSWQIRNQERSQISFAISHSAISNWQQNGLESEYTRLSENDEKRKRSEMPHLEKVLLLLLFIGKNCQSDLRLWG
jgi:hypothetical protein